MGLLARLVPGRTVEHDPRLFHLADRFNLNLDAGFTPINTFIAYWTCSASQRSASRRS